MTDPSTASRDERRVLIIPAFNEAGQLGDVLDAVASAVPGFEVAVIDDGSTDDTAEIARRHDVVVLRHPFNLGYGAAVQTGYKYALRRGATLLVQMDADGQHHPTDVAALAEPVARGELDLVIGSRFLGPAGYRMGLARSIGRRFFRALARGFGLDVTDPTSGLQAMNQRVLSLYASDFFPTDYPDVDVVVMAHRHGLRVGERSVEMSEGLRPSTLHDGLSPFYYVYRTLLAMWAATSRQRSG